MESATSLYDNQSGEQIMTFNQSVNSETIHLISNLSTLSESTWVASVKDDNIPTESSLCSNDSLCSPVDVIRNEHHF